MNEKLENRESQRNQSWFYEKMNKPEKPYQSGKKEKV